MSQTEADAAEIRTRIRIAESCVCDAVVPVAILRRVLAMLTIHYEVGAVSPVVWVLEANGVPQRASGTRDELENALKAGLRLGIAPGVEEVVRYERARGK